MSRADGSMVVDMKNTFDSALFILVACALLFVCLAFIAGILLGRPGPSVWDMKSMKLKRDIGVQCDRGRAWGETTGGHTLICRVAKGVVETPTGTAYRRPECNHVQRS